MTSPEDDGLEEALRRALSGAASELEPGTDGLDKIRARIGGRQSRPWLVSVLVGLVDRIGHWTWRGHWAWQDSLPRLGALRERRSRRDNFRGWGIGWLRFVTVLGGIAVVAGIALGVQPFRHAILQASDSLKGGGGSPRGSAGTEGNGTQASSSGNPTVAAVASGSEQASQVRTTASGKTGVPHPTTSSARCVSTVFPVLSGAKPTKTSAAPETSAAAPGTASASSPAPSSSAATPTQPVYTNTNAATCPVAPPTKTPTPTPTSSSSSPDPTPSDVAPTQESSPTWTDPAPTPTPTPTGFSPTGDPTSSHPSDPPSWSWQGRQERRYAGFLDRHRRRR
jgi:hypothetical protein